jgi:putative membrane protein
MIKNYTDHAANERTFLAWVRTGVTISVFGFGLEKFEIFLKSIVVNSKSEIAASLETSNILAIGPASLVLVLFGILIILLSAWHFMMTRRAINSNTNLAYQGLVPVIALSIMVIATGLFLFMELLRLI